MFNDISKYIKAGLLTLATVIGPMELLAQVIAIYFYTKSRISVFIICAVITLVFTVFIGIVYSVISKATDNMVALPMLCAILVGKVIEALFYLLSDKTNNIIPSLYGIIFFVSAPLMLYAYIAEQKVFDDVKNKETEKQRATEEKVAMKEKEELDKQNALSEKRIGELSKDIRKDMVFNTFKNIDNKEYTISKYVADEINKLIENEEYNPALLPENIAESIYLDTDQYLKMADDFIRDCKCVNYGRLSKRYGIAYGDPDDEKIYTSDNLWVITEKLRAFKGYLRRIKDGINYINKNKLLNYDDIIEKVSNDSEIYDPVENIVSTYDVQAVQLGMRHSRYTINLDKAINWVNELINKLNTYEQDFENITRDYGVRSAGAGGEGDVEEYIKEKSYPYLFNANIIKADDKNNSFENDAIWIRPEGVFVLEVKNYKNELTVNDDGSVEYVGRNGISTDSPIDQNNYHVFELEKVFDKNGLGRFKKLIKGIVVIPNTELKIRNNTDYPIVTLPFVENYITNNNSAVLSDEDIENIKTMLDANSTSDKKFTHYIPTIKSDPFENISRALDPILYAISYDSLYGVSIGYSGKMPFIVSQKYDIGWLSNVARYHVNKDLNIVCDNKTLKDIGNGYIRTLVNWDYVPGVTMQENLSSDYNNYNEEEDVISSGIVDTSGNIISIEKEPVPNSPKDKIEKENKQYPYVITLPEKSV